MAQELTGHDLFNLRMCRWKGRTDLAWLCRDVLGYTDVDDTVHGPLISRLQQFPLPSQQEFYDNDEFKRGRWRYKPLKPMLKLTGKRRVLILDSRGHLKSTINAVAHTIQWILNYPDVAILLVQSNTEKAELLLGEIKKHFQANARFRALYPEYCPRKRILDWGTKSEFTTPARDGSS